MANQNQKNVNGTTEQVVAEQPVQQNVPQQAEQTPAVQQTVPTEPQKEGFGAWCKRHWKGLTAAVLGAGGVVTSGILAYKKGKAAGAATVPMPVVEQEDYSLNPNE